MANNEHINKVVKSTGETLIDLTSDTVTAETLLKDVTAHDRSGAQITGAVIVAPTDVTETEDNEAFLYKSSEHDAVYDELVGGSVAWNQLVQNGNFESTSRWSGRYSTISVSNNVCTVTPSSNGTFRGLIGVDTITDTTIAGHKYLISVDVLSPVNTNIALSMEGIEAKFAYAPANAWRRCACIWTNTSSTRRRIYALLVDNVTTSQTIMYKNVYAIDLTQMFGSTIADYVYNLEQSTAGSGIAWLKSYSFFTEDYYPYNSGALTSVNVSGKKVVGKNLLDASQIVVGSIGGQGQDISSNTRLRTAYISVLPNTTYTAISGNNVQVYEYHEYRTDKSHIKFVSINATSGSNTMSPDTHFIRLLFRYSDNRIMEVSDMPNPQLELGSTATNYEPYTSLTYPIQSTDLRGLYKLNGNKLYTDGDIYSSDGTVTRKYGIVGLGTLDWQLTSGVFTPTTDIGAKVQSIQGTLANILCPKYVTIQQNQISGKDKVIFGLNWGTGVGIIDSTYSDVTTFKTAMSGVYLIYELATPTTETAQPLASPQMVYRNGTEEYLDTRDVPMPVGGNRKYVDIPEWMVNEYFDDVRAETSTVSNIIEKLRRIDVTNGSSSTVRTIYAPDDSNGIQTTVRNSRTEVRVACGQASNANGRVVFTDSRIWGGIGNPTSISSNHFMFNDNCGSDSIGKLSSGSPLTGSNFSLNYETINLKGSTINIDDNMSMVFETEDDFTVNTINSPYMMINTDGISLLPKTLSYFSLLISRLPSGAGSELVVNSNGTVYQSSSSRDIKHDIQYIENTDTYHDALMRIKPATYVYNNDASETTKLGMIAEDIADVMPIAALTDECGKVENYDTRAIIAMLVMEVQRLNADIRRLRGDSNAD